VSTNPALRISEADLQRTVMDAAKTFGWKVAHFRAVQQARGWGVPYEGDVGLPDLVLARNGKILLAELKSDRGVATVEQKTWLAAAGGNGRLWRPADLPTILDELRGKP
jgi:hypothetical protein